MSIKYDWLCEECWENNCSCNTGNKWLVWKEGGKIRDCTYCDKKGIHTLKCICDLRKCPVGCGHSLERHEKYTDRFTKYKCCDKHEFEGRCEMGYWCRTCNHSGVKCNGVTKDMINKIPKKTRFESEVLDVKTIHQELNEEDFKLRSSGGNE